MKAFTVVGVRRAGAVDAVLHCGTLHALRQSQSHWKAVSIGVANLVICCQYLSGVQVGALKNAKTGLGR